MSPQVWQKGAKAQPYCQYFQAVYMKVTFLLRPGAGGRFAVAHRPPTEVGGVCRDHLPSADHAQGHTSFHPLMILPRAKAVMQAWLTLIRRHPWRQASGGTRGFSQYQRGRIWSRPNWSTEDTEAMRSSILWNALRGRGTPSLNEAASCWIASASSGVTNIPHSGDKCSQERNCALNEHMSRWARRLCVGMTQTGGVLSILRALLREEKRGNEDALIKA